jgi:predicted P-loop ATPase
MVAAVARAIVGGVKYDYMPILAGPQGLGKSTLLATLGGKWFSDSLTTFEGKDAAEMLQGTWINEIGELAAMSKYESAQVKQFLSKRSDIYRAAYGRRTEEHPRRCVFFGTSNDSEFLRDQTGNRRFWPVDVGIRPEKLSPWDDLPGNVDQIWAEAVMYWRFGEPLYLTGEVEKMAIEAQEEHREASQWEGMIRDFLDTEVPLDWDDMDVSERRTFLNGNSSLPPEKPLRKMDKVCAVEIWAECLNGDPRFLKKQEAEMIGRILNRIPGWERIVSSDNKPSTARFGPYKTQRGFRRSIVNNGVNNSE